jgi:hypothetical protein
MPHVCTLRSLLLSPVSRIAACFLLLACAMTSAQNVDFVAGRNFPASQSDTSVSLTVEGDFNGDGKPDLVTVTGTQIDTSVSILLGNGDGAFTPPQPSVPDHCQGLSP